MYRRWNRVSCDLSVLGAAVAYELADGKIRGLRLALGGLGPKARRFPELETLFEGKVLPDREEIESTVRPFLHPIDDLRASAAFKRLRGAQLLADALLDAADRKDACA
jgi:CO/xanthine dehydrogenase FAD-binding subunit